MSAGPEGLLNPNAGVRAASLKYQPGEVIGAWTLVSYDGDSHWVVKCSHCGATDVFQPIFARYGRVCRRCPWKDRPRVTIDAIRKAVCQRFKITEREIVSQWRTWRLSRPRMIAMSLCRELTPRSLPKIGLAFGGRDHTTVLHAVRRIAALRTSDPLLDEDYTALRDALAYQPANDEAAE